MSPYFVLTRVGSSLKAMYNFVWNFAFFSLFRFDILVTGATSINQADRPVTPILSGPIPPGFSINIQSPRGSPLSGIHCLEAGVLLIGGHLALEDFTGAIATQGWREGNLFIAISTATASADTIERRYVIWGIYAALTKMTLDNDYRSAIVLLIWQGNVLGSVTFYQADSPGLNAQGHLANLTTQLASPPSSIDTGTNGSVLLSPTALGARRIKLKFSQEVPPRALDPFGLYLNVIGVLMLSAEHSADEIISRRFSLVIGDFGVRVSVTGKNGQQPPDAPPYLRHRWVIEALTAIPTTLGDLAVYNAFRIEIKFGSITIAEIDIEPGTASAPLNLFVEPSINVSTS